MAFTQKISMQEDVFSGISAVYAVAGGLPDGLDCSSSTGVEFPVSDDSGFNFDTGQPSINHFKVKGLNSDWVNTFTPGDGEIKLEVPCNKTDILTLCFGAAGTAASPKLPSGVAAGGVNGTGTSYPMTQKAVKLGLLILNDTEDKVLFIKKAKFMAQIIFDGSNKPLCVVLTGTIANGTATDSFGIADLAPAT